MRSSSDWTRGSGRGTGIEIDGEATVWTGLALTAAAASAPARRPLAAARLPRRQARLVLPRPATLFEIGDLGELGHGGGREVGEAQHHGFDAGVAEVAGFEPSRGASQASVEALDDRVGLRPVGGLQDASDVGGRTHLVAAPAARLHMHPGEVRRAERHAGLVARQTGAASGGEAVHALNWKVHG